jgi:hypothetical protein
VSYRDFRYRFPGAVLLQIPRVLTEDGGWTVRRGMKLLNGSVFRLAAGRQASGLHLVQSVFSKSLRPERVGPDYLFGVPVFCSTNAICRLINSASGPAET